MGLNWLNPIALWGLAALAIPILIHLWSKNKTKEIPFGSIRFLKESSTLQSKKIQISELPILFLRLLILALVVALMANFITQQKVESHKAVLLGKGIELPKAYTDQEIPIFHSSDFENDVTSNRYDLLQELATKYPEVDSMIYIDDFSDTDFIGAIPRLSFHLELIPTGQLQAQISSEKLSLDTLLIHFDSLPQMARKKIDKVLKANSLYTQGKVNFKDSTRQEAQLIISNSTQKLEVNQIVLSDTLSSNYQLHQKHTYRILYLNGSWMDDPLNEDQFLLVLSEFIAQLVEPNYQYSSFAQLYTRYSEESKTVYQSKNYAQELLWLIMALLMTERYFSYRKRYA